MNPKSKIFQLLYISFERNNLSLIRTTEEKYNRLLFANSIIHNNIALSIPRSYNIDIKIINTALSIAVNKIIYRCLILDLFIWPYLI